MKQNENKLLELIQVDAGYNGVRVLKNINLEIQANDFIGVIGPNGGGKTTLVKILLGLLQPMRGKVINHMQSKGSYLPIGYLPQISRIDTKFPIRVLDVVLSGFMDRNRMRKRFSSLEKQQATLIMQEMGIETIAKRPIGELSGGQMQRAFLARAIVSSPLLLILDEPNTFVDNTFESELYERLVKLNDTMAIMVVSHDVGMISSNVKTIACVNRELHYHRSNRISEEQLRDYNCPIQLITHGDVPHTVLEHHNH